MMDTVNQLLTQLKSRLPELEWNLSKCASIFYNQMLPKGVFQSSSNLSGKSCIEEIHSDIAALTARTNESCALFLAQRIQNKINVLVRACQLQKTPIKAPEKKVLTLNRLSTRNQWIQDIEEEIRQLESQQQAMHLTLEKNGNNQNTGILKLQSALGDIEKRLTLAREALDKAMLI